MFPIFQSAGSCPRLYEVSNNIFSGVAILCLSSYNIRGWILSGPGDLVMFKLSSFFNIICSLMIGSREENWQALGCVVEASANSFPLLKTLTKKFPSTSAFSELVQAVSMLPSLSWVFRSPMWSRICCLLLIYFQNIFGFFLHCVATFFCSSNCCMRAHRLRPTVEHFTCWVVDHVTVTVYYRPIHLVYLRDDFVCFACDRNLLCCYVVGLQAICLIIKSNA